MGTRLAIFIVLILFGSGLCGCESPPIPGFLHIQSNTAGQYEIYKFENEDTMQLVSESTGIFNESVALGPGSYLILADCSSETVIIYPNQTKKLTAHTVQFSPPLEPQVTDSFSIQCSRNDNTRSRQHISNRYEFTLLHGKRDMLVGLVPLSINFNELGAEDTSRTLSYDLAALQVAAPEKDTKQSSYFVSPKNELISVTKSQELGKWEFILPGDYVIELNGTKMSVSIKAHETRIIHPASLIVETRPDVSLEEAAQIKGSPQLVEINSGHWLNFNELYPILPGNQVVQLSGSTRKIPFEVAESESKVFKTKAVKVEQGCSPWEWNCLGRRDVILYLEKMAYPFVESVTDIPVLYIDDGSDVWVGVGGSRDIRYKIPSKSHYKMLKVGYVNFVPEPEHRPGQLTDLIRVESINLPFEGVSLDLNLETSTRMPLVSGWYHLAHYVSLTSSEGERRKSKRGIKVIPGETLEVRFKVHFSEKHMKALNRKLAQKEETEEDFGNSSNYNHDKPLKKL